jgi:hypothetical protein
VAHNEPGADQEIEALAHAIVGPERGSEQVANAELGLRRVRSAQTILANPPPPPWSRGADSSEVVNGVSPHAVVRRRNLGNDFEAGALERYELKGAPGRAVSLRSGTTTPPGRD